MGIWRGELAWGVRGVFLDGGAEVDFCVVFKDDIVHLNVVFRVKGGLKFGLSCNRSFKRKKYGHFVSN